MSSLVLASLLISFDILSFFQFSLLCPRLFSCTLLSSHPQSSLLLSSLPYYIFISYIFFCILILFSPLFTSLISSHLLCYLLFSFFRISSLRLPLFTLFLSKTLVSSLNLSTLFPHIPVFVILSFPLYSLFSIHLIICSLQLSSLLSSSTVLTPLCHAATKSSRWKVNWLYLSLASLKFVRHATCTTSHSLPTILIDGNS